MTSLAFLLTPRFLDVVIVLLVAELVGLTIYRTVTGRGMRPNELLAFLGAGLAMMIALRISVGGGGVEWFAIAMAASLVLHVWHVAQRWRH